MATVRWWAASKAAAGVESEVHDAASVGALLAAAVASRGEAGAALARIVAMSSVLVDGDPVGTRDRFTVPLLGGETVEVLPPFAGG